MKKLIPVIGYGYGNASSNSSANQGPLAAKEATANIQELKWQEIISAKSNNSGLSAIDDVQTVCLQLSKQVHKCLNTYKNFLVIGGDHSSAIGTWNGASKYLTGDLGLIWLDAHLDSHTEQSSHSQNIHGMPLAALLGYGNPKIAQLEQNKPILKPQNVKIIGVTDFEKKEQALLNSLHVEIKPLNKLAKQDPLPSILQAVKELEKTTDGFGISLDLDAFSPENAPAVTTYAKNGIDIEQTIKAIAIAAKSPKFIGLEIAEFTPEKDVDNKTLNLICKIIQQTLLNN